MIRGYYTGASGMTAQQFRLDAISNNLANVDTTGYKRETSVHKSFAELLIRRMNDDGLYLHPLGSGDYMPMIGKLGTGVETNELFTEFEQGALKNTESDFDFALDGKGFLCVSTPRGERYTRNGNFILGKEGYLETKEGLPVLGERGPIMLKAGNFKVDADGVVWVNGRYQNNDENVSVENNQWEDMVAIDRLKIVEFKNDRYLAKQGSSLYVDTLESGQARVMEGEARPQVIQGFVEAANVNPVTEMVRMIEVNRAYEANQKSVQSADAMLGKLINEVARV
jgi:flagellar basal-body rod protein FlgG